MQTQQKARSHDQPAVSRLHLAQVFCVATPSQWGEQQTVSNRLASRTRKVAMMREGKPAFWARRIRIDAIAVITTPTASTRYGTDFGMSGRLGKREWCGTHEHCAFYNSRNGQWLGRDKRLFFYSEKAGSWIASHIKPVPKELSIVYTISLRFISLWNSTLWLSEKGFFGIAFILSLFSAIVVQKNTRDNQSSPTAD